MAAQLDAIMPQLERPWSSVPENYFWSRSGNSSRPGEPLGYNR